MSGLGATRQEGETWRACVERYAGRHGLQVECLEIFDEAVARGVEESQAAFEALYEWDVLDLVDDEGKPIPVKLGPAKPEPFDF